MSENNHEIDMNHDDHVDDHVPGERQIPSVTRGQSLQSKMNNVFAMALILLLGGGFLTWYYTNMYAKKNAEEEKRKQEQEQLTHSSGSLPKLGAVPFPQVKTPAPPEPVESVDAGNLFGPAPGSQANVNNGPKEPTPEEVAQMRRLTTPVYVKPNNNMTGGEQPSADPNQRHANLTDSIAGQNTDLAKALQPTTTAMARAEMLPSLTFVIPKGRKGDCTLETAIDSQLPGMVTCVLAHDIFGADGKVPLLKRGTSITGETRTNVQQGQSRVFVLWTDARTEAGVVAQLASPATDSLGRSGITGEIDNHFWDRFGAAILISVINGVIQAGTNYASGAGNSGGGTTLNYNTQQTNQVMTEVLRNTVNIPPTIRVPQGERVQILFARDVDFRSVYALADKYQYIYDEAEAKYRQYQ
jgi:type IV secretion system protein VirB10